MDKIIYNNKLSDTIRIWNGFANYIKLDHFPFNEVEIEIDDENTRRTSVKVSIIFKGDRIITTAGNNRQVSYIELNNGEIHVTRTSYTDFKQKEQIEQLEYVSIETLTLIFTFVANYNLPQNENVKAVFAMRELFNGNISLGKIASDKVTTNNKKTSKVRVNNNKLLDLVTVARTYKVHGIEGDKREYNRTCTAWTVKGFPRHLKSGKTIWIKPSVRGKDKNKIQDKIYKI